jgi:hypothetical protein
LRTGRDPRIEPLAPKVRAGRFHRRGLNGVLDRLVEERHIPDRGHGILENCIVRTGFPIA